MTKPRKLTALVLTVSLILAVVTLTNTAPWVNRSGGDATGANSAKFAPSTIVPPFDELSVQSYIPGQFLVGMTTPEALPAEGEESDYFPGLSGLALEVLSIRDLTDVSAFPGIDLSGAPIGAQTRVGRQILLLELAFDDIENMDELDIYNITVNAVDILESDPRVAYAEVNLIGSATSTPNGPDDTYYALGDLWGMERIEAPEAWELWETQKPGVSPGSHSVTVGVLDSGVDFHPDLAGNIDEAFGFNFLYNNPYWWYEGNDPIDDSGHGTHVSGIIGAVGNNGEGVVGICRDVNIIPLKIWDARGYGSLAEFISALAYAEYMEIPILNLSGNWKSKHDWDTYLQAMRDAVESYSGLLVVAAGNMDEELDPDIFYPAAFGLSNVISVAASDENDELCGFSFDDPNLMADLAAPGEGIWSTVPWGYAAWRGASMASPHVTGTAALLLAFNNDLTAAELKDAILENVDEIPELNGKVSTGGRLNVYNALGSIEPGDDDGAILPEYIEIEVLGYYEDYEYEYENEIIPAFAAFFYELPYLAATVYPTDADQTVTWNYTDIDAGGSDWIDENGIMTFGGGIGHVMITATASNGVTSSVIILVLLHR